VKQARAWLVEQGVLSPESRGRIKAEHMEMWRKRGIPSQQQTISTSSTTSTDSKPEPAKPANAGAAKKDGAAPPPAEAPRKTAASAPAKKAEPAKATA
jgi:cell division protein FtsN